MIIAALSLKSLAFRKTSAGLTLLSIALSVFLLLGVEKFRTGVKHSFLQTISGTDLIVGPRSSPTQLLLYSVFHIGDAGNNVSMASLKILAQLPPVKWLVPISLGDSHRGFRVVGTTPQYFQHIKAIDQSALEIVQGQVFNSNLEAVLGSQVARKHNYKIGDEVTLDHGTGAVSFSKHSREKFRVKGILGASGTPADKNIFVSLQAIEEMHNDWQGQKTDNAAHASAAFIGLKSPISVLSFQRFINQYRGEPLTAAIPGVAFAQIWQLTAIAQSALLAIAGLVALTAIIGLVVSLLSGLNERRREMAILRSIGAQPMTILLLLIFEALLITTGGVVSGIALLYGSLWLFQDPLAHFAGLHIPITWPGSREFVFVALLFLAALAGAIIPALRAYKMSLSDGLAMRL